MGLTKKYVMHCSASPYDDLNYCSLLFGLKWEWLGDLNSIAFACYSLYRCEDSSLSSYLWVCNVIDVGDMVI